jgi:hypothetical protein
MFQCHFPTFLAVVVAAGWCASRAEAEPPKKKTDAVRSALAEETEKWVGDGRGKLTEDDVIAKLGLPDFVENPIDPDSASNPDADILMVWQDVSRIEVVFKGDKAKQISAQFSPHLKPEKVTLANFRKLKAGASPSDVEELLGKADSKAELAKGTTRCEWAAKRVLKVYFKGGKVTGVGWKSQDPLG